MSGDTSEEFTHPYQAATMLPPGRQQLSAMRQFLAEEVERLAERLDDIEADDGSIPDDARAEWAMAKGRLDQARSLQTLVGMATARAALAEVDDDE